MSRAVFHTVARLEMASRAERATVMIERESGVVEIRPFRRRRRYTTTLAAIAEMVVRAELAREAAERRRAGRKRRA